MIRRPHFEPKLEPITVLFEQKTLPVRDELTWAQEYDRRAKFLFEKFRVQLTTPRRREKWPEGYVPTEPYNSEGVRIRGVKQDSHRAGVTVR